MIFNISDANRSTSVAVIDASTGQQWNFGEVARAVARYQAELPQEKELAFVFCVNDMESLLWYLAALDAGHAVALLDAGLNGDFRANLIATYKPEMVVFGGGPPMDGYGRTSQRNLWRRIAPDSPERPLHPDLGLLLSTSGTTGNPKFVRLTYRNLTANAASICEALSITREDRAVGSLPMHYSYGLSVINTHLLAGASLLLTPEGIMSQLLWDSIRRYSCTSLAGVPYTYQSLRRLNLDRLNVPSIRTCTQAGGKLENDQIAHFHAMMTARRGRFFVMYGQTEAGPRISILPSVSLPEKLGSVGLPVPGGSFTVADDGELVYEGPNVMMGYALNRADLAKGDELGGRLHTGDRAHVDSGGYLYVLGRIGREVKLYGLRIDLDSVETLLRRYGPTAVTVARDRLVIFCEHGDPAAYRKYAQELSEKLSLNFRAFEFLGIEKLPLDSRGKIDYRHLEGDQ